MVVFRVADAVGFGSLAYEEDMVMRIGATKPPPVEGVQWRRVECRPKLYK
jgi:hypothetical protein